MLFYLLPSVASPMYPNLCFDVSTEPPVEMISNSLAHFLYDIKEKISSREKDWDIYKKYTNGYEYIHSIVQSKKKSVSKYKPLSRSYFKMVELVHDFHLLPDIGNVETGSANVFSKKNNPRARFGQSTPIRTFHLAEGPGGFIEAVVNLRKNPCDSYIGMTILDEHQNHSIPAWKKSEFFLYSNPHVSTEPGIDGTGDILSLANFDHCAAKYASSMDFITADGGFDFSTDFNKQEIQMARLLFAQIAFALAIQKPDGHFVLKMFDCFHTATVDLLCILSSFYKTVYIAKPQTSRPGNSEKYVVCKGFRPTTSTAFLPHLRRVFAEMTQSQNVYVRRFLSRPIPLYFSVRVEEYNSIFGQQQIENIHTTLLLVDKPPKADRIDYLIKTNISKCVQWCIRYNVPYHVFVNTNVFL
jgi:23S rRNA U2552 (ribose-2'-O)-methylase RlmE/FtsJ